MSKFRRQLMTASMGEPVPPTPPLPYDARIDYLESTGNQYINTGISNETVNSLVFEITCQFNATTSGYNGSGYTTSANQAFYALNSNSATGLYACFSHNTTNMPKKMSDDKTGWHTFRVEISNSITSYYLDNTLIASYSTNAFTIEKFFLFRLATNGTAIQGVKGSKISKAYLSINGVDKFDMFPVRKVQVGYMYDKVSGELFGNAGSGSFILGNDKN